MKKIWIVIAGLISVAYGQPKKNIEDARPATTFASSFFDDGKKARSAVVATDAADVFPSFADDYTGEQVTYKKVAAWIDGSPMNDSEVDGIVYRKKGDTYYRRNFRVLTPEMFGAAGDGKTDDLGAFRKLFAFAKSQNLATIEAGSGKTYLLSNSIHIDYSHQGVVDSKIHFDGNGCRIFLAKGSGGNGWWAFNITTDIVPLQNTKFDFSNITFTCNNVDRPNAIKITGACFATIDNCKFDNLGEGINFQFAGMSRINNCWAWGCVVGFLTYRSKDIYINECHAYGCDWGYRLEGVNDFGSDGNVSITNSVGNACKKYNLKVKGIYTPFISNCVFELAPVNVSIESSNYGKLSNVFCGPGRFEMIKDPALLTNDFWNISNLDCQGLVTLTSLKFSNITNCKVSVVNADNNPESTSVIFADGLKNNIAGLTVEDTRPGVKNAVVVKADCNIFTWSNLILDRPFLLKGKGRGGVQVMSASIIDGGVVTEDNAFKRSENFDYISLADGSRHSVKNGQINNGK